MVKPIHAFVKCDHLTIREDGIRMCELDGFPCVKSGCKNFKSSCEATYIPKRMRVKKLKELNKDG